MSSYHGSKADEFLTRVATEILSLASVQGAASPGGTMAAITPPATPPTPSSVSISSSGISSDSPPAMTSINAIPILDGDTHQSYEIDFRTRAYLSTENDYHDYIEDILGEITCVEDGPTGQTRSHAGLLNGFRIKVDQVIKDREDLFEVCDFHSLTLHEYSCEIFDFRTQELKPKILEQFPDMMEDNILIIDRVELLPQHRGRGVGLASASRLMDTFGYGCGLVIGEPFPLQFKEMTDTHAAWCEKMGIQSFASDRRKALSRLRSYWSRLGFQLLTGTKKFALCPAYPRPSLAQVLAKDRET